MPNPLDKLNEDANARFNELKKKLLAKSRELPGRMQTSIITEQKFEELSTSGNAKRLDENHRRESSEANEFLSKIDSLNVSSNLSLAISFIVIGEYQPELRKENLQKAIQILEAEL